MNERLTGTAELEPTIVLFAVMGTAPAVLTETVWALAFQNDPPIIPHRIIVLTTEVGEERLGDELLAKGSSRKAGLGGGETDTIWDALKKEVFSSEKLELPEDIQQRLEFHPGSSYIKVFEERPTRGQRPKKRDVRNDDDTLVVGDKLVEELHALTNPALNNRIVASIAGGRKSFGALLYGAMTLLGRPGDRLTHVLVNDDRLESRSLEPRFYFPRQGRKGLHLWTEDPYPPKETPEKVKLKPEDDCISLSEVPFVPLRQGLYELPDALLHPLTFSRMVERYRNLEVPIVQIDDQNGRILLNGKNLRVQESGFAPIAFLLRLNVSLRAEILPRSMRKNLAGTSLNDLAGIMLYYHGEKKQPPQTDNPFWRRFMGDHPLVLDGTELDPVQRLLMRPRLEKSALDRLRDKGPNLFNAALTELIKKRTKAGEPYWPFGRTPFEVLSCVPFQLI